MASLDSVEHLRAAAIDGRTDNIRYRQNELQNLHETLRNHAETILSAISKDGHGSSSGVNSRDADAEYYLAMHAVKSLYHSLDFGESLKNEYQIANGADNTSRRVGKGIVVIRPTTHTRFYSIICPLATAIAAGNCVCLELENTMLNVDLALKDLLPETMDMDTFYISNTKFQESSILSAALLVDQSSNSSEPTVNQLISNASARTVAVVDRTADIELAAKSIVNARFSFQGTSPYSPDLVIVNDFIKSEFTAACTRHASKFFSSNMKTKLPQSSKISEMSKATKEAERKGQVSIFGSSNFAFVDVHERTSPISNMKITGFHLPIMECTSLVSAIMLQKSESSLLAVYLFSDRPTAKFLAQHFDASTVYVNQIPGHLLIGPAAPITQVAAPACHKYSVEMFSSQRPQYIASQPADLSLIDEILGATSQLDGKGMACRKARKIAVEQLPKTGQAQGHAIGFFEQGLLLGAGIFCTVVIPIVDIAHGFLGKVYGG